MFSFQSYLKLLFYQNFLEFAQNLPIFDYLLSLLWSKVQEQVCFCLWTIFLKVWLRMAYEHSLARSVAVEWLDVLERPWGLANFVLNIPIYFASLFIYLKKMPTPLPPSAIFTSPYSPLFSSLLISLSSPSFTAFSRQPPTSAIIIAASFPLGSIIPQNRSSRLYTAPYFSSALVPLMEHARCDTLTLVFLALSLRSQSISKIVIRFIILVRLATSRFLKFRFPYRQRPSRISYKIQLFAVTSGMCRYGRSRLRPLLAALRPSTELLPSRPWLEAPDLEESGRCFGLGVGSWRISLRDVE